MKKKLLSILLALCMVLSVVPLGAIASAGEGIGFTSDAFTATLNNDGTATLTISFTDEIIYADLYDSDETLLSLSLGDGNEPFSSKTEALDAETVSFIQECGSITVCGLYYDVDGVEYDFANSFTLTIGEP
ncbi:MAG TPA: hypothetical protein DDY98_03915, partial [Ruminococcaceae bacterium]|nr:hypothetical protein [Oscillospiraceae bacterium]